MAREQRRRYEQCWEGPFGWCQWQQPRHRDYRVQCCKCSLTHELQFRVVRGRVQLRARRVPRRRKARP